MSFPERTPYSSVTGTIEGGTTLHTAVVVDSDNLSSATWYWTEGNPSVWASLGGEGIHSVWVGQRGLDGKAYWIKQTVVVDTTPPVLIVTNPLTTATSRPMIQLQGFSPEPLASVSYDISNDLGTVTNIEGHVLRQYYDTNIFMITTNWFQCFDIELTNGNNTITLRATDLAGNTRVTNITYVVDYSIDHTAPALTLHYPLNNAVLSGDKFTLRGMIDDPTASVSATITDANANSTTVAAVIERDGLLWVDDLPLSAGNSTITLTATDVAGNTAVTTLAVAKSALALTLTMNTPSQADLAGNTARITGTFNGGGYTIWVNGVPATMTGPSWVANGVPVYRGGTAVIQARAIQTGSEIPNTAEKNNINPGNPTDPGAITVESDVEQPSKLYIESYYDRWTYDRTGGEGHMGDEPIFAEQIWSYTYNKKTAYESLHYIMDPASSFPGSWTDMKEFSHWDDPDQFPLGGISQFVWSDGSSAYFDNVQLFEIPNIFANFSAILPPSANSPYPEKQTRNAATIMTLQTGGRALSQLQNIFSVSASATRLSPYGGPVPAVAPESIKVLGDYLAPDGKTYLALQDNKTLDATPQLLAGVYYSFTLEVIKHRATILANTIPLRPDKVRMGASFCVGQKVTFSVYFSPELPQNTMTVLWALPGKYVNDYTQLHESQAVGDGTFIEVPKGSRNYYANSALLGNATTYAWWVQGGYPQPDEMDCTAKLTITFANTKSATIRPPGKFSIYRPAANLRHRNNRGAPTMTIQNPTAFPACLIKLGDLSGGNCMAFDGQISTRFSGKAFFTQICSLGTPSVSVNSRLDNEEAFKPPVDISATENPTDNYNLIIFTDGPSSYWFHSPDYLTGDFTAHLRFVPSEGSSADNIPITLGVVYWSCNGQATYSPPWTLTENSVWLSEVLIPSDAFPLWEDVWTNPP